MTSSSSDCFCVALIVVLLQLCLVSASTKYIDTICNTGPVTDKAFCIKTLSASSASSAPDLLSTVKIAIKIGMSQAKKVEAFIAKVTKRESTTIKKQFDTCNYAYKAIVGNLKSAFKELTEDPMTANYDVKVYYDQTHIVENVVGKNSDKSSKSLMKMTLMMDKFIEIAVRATNALDYSQH